MNVSAGLYVHVPFCTSVCPYCDFAVTIAGEERRREYVEAVLCEADHYRDVHWRFETLYLGGGTPSSLEPDLLSPLVEGVREALGVPDSARLFLEVNPEDVTADRIAAWRSLGVQTVSLGLQALDDPTLCFLGRRHDAATGRAATRRLLEAGFETVSVDLIYGLAGQDTAGWRRVLDEAVGLGPHHLSCYQLTVEDGTLFGRRRQRGARLTTDEETQAELFLLTHRMLADAGYAAYEVSNFARSEDHRSLHNSRYWDHTPYLGLGPSAHSFDGRRRWWNHRLLRRYCRELTGGRMPVEGDEVLGDGSLALEEVMLGLRTPSGVDVRRLERRHQVRLVEDNRETLKRWTDAGLVRLGGGRLRPTLDGMAVAEALAAALEVRSKGRHGPARPGEP